MKPLYKDQPVRYVRHNPDDTTTIVDATIIDSQPPNEAHVRVPDGVALAAYNEDKKTPNTFHFPDEAAPAAAAPAAPKALAKSPANTNA